MTMTATYRNMPTPKFKEAAYGRIRRAFKTLRPPAPISGAAIAHMAKAMGCEPELSAVYRAAKFTPKGNRRVLLSESAKTEATEAHGGWLNRIIYLSPADLAGLGTLCPWATPACIRACLNTAGRGQMTRTQYARVCKTFYLYLDPLGFRADLLKEIAAAERSAVKQGKRLAYRGDGTTDTGLSEYLLDELGPAVDPYDYTKDKRRALAFRGTRWNVTLSATSLADAMAHSESHRRSTSPVCTKADAMAIGEYTPNMTLLVKAKGETSIYKAKAEVERIVAEGLDWWHGPLVNGDISDARHLDPDGALVLLAAKGKALKGDDSEFVWSV